MFYRSFYFPCTFLYFSFTFLSTTFHAPFEFPLHSSDFQCDLFRFLVKFLFTLFLIGLLCVLISSAFIPITLTFPFSFYVLFTFLSVLMVSYFCQPWMRFEIKHRALPFKVQCAVLLGSAISLNKKKCTR